MLKSLATTICACMAAVTMSAQTPAPAKSVAKAHRDTPASLRKEAKISEKTARATALKEVPNGKVTSYEIERENGNLIWSYDIKVAGKSGIEEITVNAITGAVVTHEHETPKAEKKEAAAEKKG
jgi:uncharacterized membrane protein YkoI